MEGGLAHAARTAEERSEAEAGGARPAEVRTGTALVPAGKVTYEIKDGKMKFGPFLVVSEDDAPAPSTKASAGVCKKKTVSAWGST